MKYVYNPQKGPQIIWGNTFAGISWIIPCMSTPDSNDAPTFSFGLTQAEPADQGESGVNSLLKNKKI